MTPQDRFEAELAEIFGEDVPARIGVAVSGGGDSVALLCLLTEWSATRRTEIVAATVDHGLRAGSAEEAAGVADLCRDLGVRHQVLRWRGWDQQGNLQAEARSARYGLLAVWAADVGTEHICLGHTRDDQAETLFLRLARGSGVDGLAAMKSLRIVSRTTWVRPLLRCGRAELRDWLQARRVAWVDDPSNENDDFDRIKVRRLLADPPVSSLSVQTLAATADRMQAAARVLRSVAAGAAERMVEIEGGDLVFPVAYYFGLEDDTRWRVLAACIGWTTGEVYRPRFSALLAADMALREGKAATLQGAIVRVRKGAVRVGREPAALTGVKSSAPGLWDDRWRVELPTDLGTRNLTIGALTESALRDLGRPDSDLPRQTLMASPAVFDGDKPIAAPLAFPRGTWQAQFVRDKASLILRLLSD